MSVALLEIDGLTVDLPIAHAMRRVIHDVTLSIDSGEAVGLVGESGSGKSMTARADHAPSPSRSAGRWPGAGAGRLRAMR